MAEEKNKRRSKAFLMRYDWRTAIDGLPDADAGKLIKLLYAFAEDGELPPADMQKTDPFVWFAFNIISVAVLSDERKYADISEKRSAAAKSAADSKRQKKLAEKQAEEQAAQEQEKIECDEYWNSL